MCYLKIFHIYEGPKGGGGGLCFYEENKAHLRFTIIDSHFTVYEDNTKLEVPLRKGEVDAL